MQPKSSTVQPQALARSVLFEDHSDPPPFDQTFTPETLLAQATVIRLRPTAGGMGAGVSAAVIPLVPQPADDGRISGALSTP